jgi:hypothetical protein
MAFSKVDHLNTNLMELAKFVKHEKLRLSAFHGRPRIQFVHLDYAYSQVLVSGSGVPASEEEGQVPASNFET